MIFELGFENLPFSMKLVISLTTLGSTVVMKLPSKILGPFICDAQLQSEPLRGQ